MKQRGDESWGQETLFVRGSRHRFDGQTQGVPTVQPISMSTTYLYESAQALERAFDAMLVHGEEEMAYVYARQANPNARALEGVMAQVEGGAGAVAFGSGMAAIHAALLAGGLVTGSKLVAARDLYGSTVSLLRQVFGPLGVEVVVGDWCCEEASD